MGPSLVGVKLAMERLLLWRELERGKLLPKRNLEYLKAILLLRNGTSMAIGVVLRLVQYAVEAAAAREMVEALVGSEVSHAGTTESKVCCCMRM